VKYGLNEIANLSQSAHFQESIAASWDYETVPTSERSHATLGPSADLIPKWAERTRTWAQQKVPS